MKEIIIILAILIILYFLYKFKKSENNDIKNNEIAENKIIEEKIYIEEYPHEENGKKYKLVEKIRENPRYTYLKARLYGKYWGEINENYTNQFGQSKFFDFNIYEVKLKNANYSIYPFVSNQDLKIPRERLPKLIHTIFENEGNEYEVNLHDPIFEDIEFNQKLHQDDGNEVFGTIEAIVTGYIIDFKVETYFEKIYKNDNDKKELELPIQKIEVEKTQTPTGEIDLKKDYKRIEYYYSDYKQTYWGDWKYIKPANVSNNEGCFSSFIGALALIIGIFFLLLILPQISILIPFFLILLIINLIPKNIFSGFFKIIGILFLMFFIISLINFFFFQSNLPNPKPIVTENNEDKIFEEEPIVDSLENKNVKDTLIKHHRVWQDYDDNQYKGVIWTKKSDFINSKSFKNNLVLNQDSEQSYDEMIYRLKENDKYKLKGIYQLFDSINNVKKLSKIKFAELVVSFIQDIPYSLILPNDCKPELYNDKFISDYLSSNNPKCDGFQKFGINSPVEFMSNLNGDCDSRTLLLYTIFVHYDYDVALLSSEYYSHSILGINLPLSGVAYKYQYQRYVLWETTAPNIRAGVLPNEISNLNYWRISLKSK